MKKSIKKPCNCEEEYEYKGVTFINFQSGTPNEPDEYLLSVFGKLIVDLQKEKIRTYLNFQIGTPAGGCGAPPKRPC